MLHEFGNIEKVTSKDIISFVKYICGIQQLTDQIINWFPSNEQGSLKSAPSYSHIHPSNPSPRECCQIYYFSSSFVQYGTCKGKEAVEIYAIAFIDFYSKLKLVFKIAGMIFVKHKYTLK